MVSGETGSNEKKKRHYKTVQYSDHLKQIINYPKDHSCNLHNTYVNDERYLTKCIKIVLEPNLSSTQAFYSKTLYVYIHNLNFVK